MRTRCYVYVLALLCVANIRYSALTPPPSFWLRARNVSLYEYLYSCDCYQTYCNYYRGTHSSSLLILTVSSELATSALKSSPGLYTQCPWRPPALHYQALLHYKALQSVAALLSIQLCAAALLHCLLVPRTCVPGMLCDFVILFFLFFFLESVTRSRNHAVIGNLLESR